MVLIAVPSLGRYVERNPAQGCWTLTASARHATRFVSTDQALQHMQAVIIDCCEVWELPPDAFTVRELP